MAATKDLKPESISAPTRSRVYNVWHKRRSAILMITWHFCWFWKNYQWLNS